MILLGDEPAWPDRHAVTDAAAIALLVDRRALRHLTPFMVESHTLTSAAAALHVRPSTLAYWLPRLQRAGLLRRLGEVARAGRAMPVYRAAARQFTVTIGHVPFDARVRLLDDGRLRVLRRFLDGLDEAFARSSAVALGFSSSGAGITAVELVETESTRQERPYTDGWMFLHLTEPDAREFARELEQLLLRYAGRTGPTKYYAHIGLAPEARHPWRSAGDPGA